MSTVRSSDGEPPRKRVRKGTRSCWECKRRKIKCQLGSEDVPVCSGCLTRGTPCLSQEYEYPEDHDSSKGAQVGERLGRVEQLLEKLVAKISAYEDEENSPKVMTPDSISNDVLTPFTANVLATNQQDGIPYLSLFDNDVIGRRETTQSQMATPVSQSSTSSKTCCRTPKIEKIRQALVELLPSQKDVDLIYRSSGSWLIVQTLTGPTKEDLRRDTTFNMADVQKHHPTRIARTILYLALCMQQLDPGFDTSKLSVLPSVATRMEKLITTVQSLVTSDDDMISTVDGLECLVLVGLFQINAGNPRRAWLLFRRALNIGQLMGIHKQEGCTIPGGRDMWCSIVQADRYLALLLGLPAGSGEVGFGPEETFQNSDIDKDMLFTRKLTDISGRIIDRNQTEDSRAYVVTQQIDESLDKLAKEVPQSWWEIPRYIPNDRSEEAAASFSQVMTQIWYFQLESLLHMPFMLRASRERRYEYSKFICLKSSREMLWRYLALRNAGIRSFCCKVVDFGALTATVTLFLDLLDSSNPNEQQGETDRSLIASVLASMEELSRGTEDIVATQSVNVIKSLQAVDSQSGHQTGNLKLTIPYFGTINIARPSRPQASTPPTPPSIFHTPHCPAIAHTRPAVLPVHDWQNAGVSYTDPAPTQNNASFPLVSFTSSQFPSIPDQQGLQDWTLTEADTLLFDSLVSTDLEGKWIF